MCGRISRTSPREALADEFGVAPFVNVDLRPRYNVAPSPNIETIIRVGDEKRLGPMRWGFVPTAAKDPKLAPINARAETLATSPMFGEVVWVQWDDFQVRIVDLESGMLLREHLRHRPGNYRTEDEDRPPRTPRGTQALLLRAERVGKHIGRLAKEIYAHEKGARGASDPRRPLPGP